MPDSIDAPQLPRREFLKRVGAAGLAVSLVGANALAQGTSSAGSPSTPAAAAAKPDSASTTPPPPSEDALALTAMLQRRFPDRLSKEQWAEVTRGIDGRLATGKRLRAIQLANGDEPDFKFEA
jgi:hypothetical protein